MILGIFFNIINLIGNYEQKIDKIKRPLAQKIRQLTDYRQGVMVSGDKAPTASLLKIISYSPFH